MYHYFLICVNFSNYRGSDGVIDILHNNLLRDGKGNLVWCMLQNCQWSGPVKIISIINYFTQYSNN